MKQWKQYFTALLLILFLFSGNVAAQTTKLTVKIEKGTVKQVFKEIEKQSNYLFFFVDADIPNTPVSINISNGNVNEILSTALKGTGLSYKIEGNNISIFKTEPKQNPNTSSNKRRITGRVTDKDGESLIGVSIIEESRQSNGTITNVDGWYELTVDLNSSLVYTYVGYKQHREQLRGSKTMYDITLLEDISALDELVVVGYGQQRKISNIGAQSTLKIQDIKTPSASLSTVLAGRISGVVAVQRSGEPGKDGADIWIRGISTPNSSKPLILVDGVERDFNDIDPQDIESLTTLKDASATAVYGVRGANGVILIKTKPGVTGTPKVNVDYYESFTRFTQRSELADGVVYMNAVNEALANNGYEPKFSEEYIENTQNRVDDNLYPNVNWMDELFNDWGHNRRINANVRGGSPNANYYASVSYFNETGLMKTDNIENYNSTMSYSRYNFATNLNLKVTPTTTVDIGAQGYLGEGNYPAISSSSIYLSAMDISPVDYPKMFYVDGVPFVPGINPNGGQRNPYADATKRGYKSETRNQIYSNLRLTQDLSMITKGLNFSAMFAYDVYSYESMSQSKRESTYYFADRENPYDDKGQPVLTRTYEGNSTLAYDKSSNGNKKTYLEASFTYDRAFGEHRVGALLLYNQQNKLIYPKDLLEEALPYRSKGYAGRLTYSWNDRYFIEMNVGYNGAENFTPKHRYGLFPAMGLGWVISNERFWEPVSPVISFLKLRYTNGKIGNSNVGDRRFMYLAQYAYDKNYGYYLGKTNQKTTGVRVVNDAVDLIWESSQKQDFGIDFKLFNDDLSVIIDLFKEHRTDILLKRDMSIPNFLGYMSDPYGNVGVVDNQGIDASVEYDKKIGKDWIISVRGNITYNKDQWINSDQPAQLYSWMNKRGSNVNGLFGLVANGLYSQDEIDQINAWEALPEVDKEQIARPFPAQFGALQAGDIKYVDLNNDGKIDAYDEKWIGQGDVPKMIYGFGFNVQYKNVAFGMLLQGTSGAERMLSGSSIQPFKGDGGGGNLFSNIYDRWTTDNPRQDVFYPRLAYGSDKADNMNNFKPSTWWIKDVDFLRLKTMQISYNLPSKWAGSVGLQNISVYCMGTNLLTLSSFKLWDPELNTGQGTSYPNIASMSIGLNIGF